jgi:hypothetical protein
MLVCCFNGYGGQSPPFLRCHGSAALNSRASNSIYTVALLTMWKVNMGYWTLVCCFNNHGGQSPPFLRCHGSAALNSRASNSLLKTQFHPLSKT